MAQLRVNALQWIESELAEMRGAGLDRRLTTLSGAAGPTAVLDGRTYLLLGSNNYLDLAAHPSVIDAAVSATRAYGAGTGASRLVSGALDIHRQLELAIADWLGTEAALIFSSGYLANVSTIQALVDECGEVFSDELNHASIIDGCRLSRARVSVYAHQDVEQLDALLSRSKARHRLIVSDTVFSMEGDSASLEDLVLLSERHGAMLMLDESHAIGVLGLRGAGLAEALGFTGRADVLMGTLSKALGSAGGFIAGSSTLVDYLRNRARGFVFDTAPAPAATAAAIAAVEIVVREPERRERLLELTALLRQRLRGLSLLDGDAAIVPLLIGAPDRAMSVAGALRDRGILAPAIRPPSVPPGTSRLRLTVSAGFSVEQVEHAARAIREVLA